MSSGATRERTLHAELLRAGVAGREIFFAVPRKILMALDLAEGDRLEWRQNPASKELRGKIFQDKELEVQSGGMEIEDLLGLPGKLLTDIDLARPDCAKQGQNLEAKGVTGKILQNKELAAWVGADIGKVNGEAVGLESARTNSIVSFPYPRSRLCVTEEEDFSTGTVENLERAPRTWQSLRPEAFTRSRRVRAIFLGAQITQRLLGPEVRLQQAR